MSPAKNAVTVGLAVLACGLGVAGCQQVPTPTTGVVTAEKAPVARPVTMPYRLAFAPQMNFVEGEEASFSIDAFVPEPGTAKVKVTGLPAGAAFDAKTLKITWKPTFETVDLAATNGQPDAYFPIIVELSGFTDGITAVKREGILRVADVIRPLVFRSQATPRDTNEGGRIVQEVEVTSPDSPRGPFTLQTSGLPEGTLVQANPNVPGKFTLTYTPNFKVVTYNQGRVTFSYVLRANGKRGETVEQSGQWTVRDVRQDPTFAVPDQIAAGESATFVISASDPNGERPPVITVDNQGTVTGSLRIVRTVDTPSTDGSTLPSSQALVRWDGMPNGGVAPVQTAPFRICTSFGQRCVRTSVRVDFSSTIHSAPSIDRSAWTLGTVQYVRMSQSQPLSLALRVLDTETNPQPVNVEILEDRDREITWQNNQLKVAGRVVGTKTFVLVARSRYGVVSRESFTYEVLPASWSQALILGDHVKDPEVSVALNAFPGAAVYDPSSMLDTGRVLALRTVVVVGTSVLGAARQDSGTNEFVRRAMSQTSNVVLASPLLDQVPTNMLTGFRLRGRYGSDLIPLRSARFQPSPGSSLFQAPTQPARLEGTLSAESATPMLLEKTGFLSSLCEDAFDLRNSNGALVGTVALVCRRPAAQGGGKLFIAGFEWADVKLAPADVGFLRDWIRQGVQP